MLHHTFFATYYEWLFDGNTVGEVIRCYPLLFPPLKKKKVAGSTHLCHSTRDNKQKKKKKTKNSLRVSSVTQFHPRICSRKRVPGAHKDIACGCIGFRNMRSQKVITMNAKEDSLKIIIKKGKLYVEHPHSWMQFTSLHSSLAWFTPCVYIYSFLIREIGFFMIVVELFRGILLPSRIPAGDDGLAI